VPRAAPKFHRPIFRPMVFGGSFALILSLLSVPVSNIRVMAQNTSETPGEEMVANLAAGRVILLVTKDAILIATIENPFEAETRVPAPVEMAAERVGILLGAEDWFSPSSRREIARLDHELPHLRASASVVGSPSLSGQSSDSKEAVDLEALGEGVRRRSSEVVQGLHAKIDLPSGEPFLEVVLADYLPGYGPEIWLISYSLGQEEQTIDYWTTSVSHPLYTQLYPPEKGQPHTLIEFDYPPSHLPTLLDLLRQNDPRFASLASSDPKLSQAVNKILDGQAQKLVAADATQFLRAAMEILTPPKARVTFSQLNEEEGFSWILRPPTEPKSPLTQPEREEGAPSLLHPSGP
jgi:hypothetical protein